MICAHLEKGLWEGGRGGNAEGHMHFDWQEHDSKVTELYIKWKDRVIYNLRMSLFAGWALRSFNDGILWVPWDTV